MMHIRPLSRKTLPLASVLADATFVDEAMRPSNDLCQSLTDHRRGRFWVGITDRRISNNVIAVIGLYKFRRNSATAWIGWFCVDDQFVRRGHGTRLFQFIERKARPNYHTLKVWTDKRNRAARLFYTSMGMMPIQTKESWIVYAKRLRDKNR